MKNFCRIFSFLILFSIVNFSYITSVNADDLKDDDSQQLYYKNSAENILKAYWLLKGLNVEDNNNIDQFLMVNECALYKQFFQDEIEWSKIRAATKVYIKNNLANFPRRFEIVQPVLMDRYDENLKGFQIKDGYKIVGVKKMEASSNLKTATPCLDSSAFQYKDFPTNAILNLSRPIDYTFIPANFDTVKEYAQYIKENNINVRDGRPAYIRYRFKVDQIIGITLDDGLSYANFYGTLESFAVFGDSSFFIKFDEQIFN